MIVRLCLTKQVALLKWKSNLCSNVIGLEDGTGVKGAELIFLSRDLKQNQHQVGTNYDDDDDDDDDDDNNDDDAKFSQV